MVDIQTISIAIASASVVAGVVYYALQLGHQTRIRKTDFALRVYSTVHTDEYVDAVRKVGGMQIRDYDDYVKKCGPWFSDSPMNRAFSTVTDFYDLVGTLLYRKHIDINLVFDLFGSRMIKMMHEKLKPIVDGVRKQLDEPTAYAGFDYLYNELMRREPQLRKTWEKASLSTGSDSNLPNESSR
jgi:hypothetical protein